MKRERCSTALGRAIARVVNIDALLNMSSALKQEAYLQRVAARLASVGYVDAWTITRKGSKTTLSVNKRNHRVELTVWGPAGQ